VGVGVGVCVRVCVCVCVKEYWTYNMALPYLVDGHNAGYYIVLSRVNRVQACRCSRVCAEERFRAPHKKLRAPHEKLRSSGSFP